MTPSIAIACFVTPHGFGHAARAAAVLAALQDRMPELRVECLTVVPPAFYESSGCGHLTVHAIRTDIGFVQQNALISDMDATIRALDAFLPFDADLVATLAGSLRQAGCRAVLCDISPLGIAVARAAGLPSILLENFRWDHLYRYFTPRHPRIGEHAAAMQAWFDRADVHIQTEPVCHRASAPALTAPPVSRRPRRPRDEVRRALGVAPGRRMVLLTMGGLSQQCPLLDHLAHRDDLAFVAAWGAHRRRDHGNVIRLPQHSDFYHPDLVNASDAVLGKIGYSTLAEVYHAGVPFGYGVRPDYPEMPALVEFAERHMAALRLPDPDLGAGVPGDFIDRLLALPRRPPAQPNGVDAVADLIAKTFMASSA